jgi:hypothetical protein
MDTPPKPKGRGCFFYGCISSLVLVLVGALTLYLGARYMIKKTVASYTDTAPVQLPDLAITQAEIDAAQNRWTAFFDAVKTDKQLPPLVFTARDLNVLAATTGTNALQGRMVVSIDGDQIKAQASLPLGKVNAGLHGRYLNGTLTLKIALEDGTLVVRPETIEVKDKPVPKWLMTKLRQQNWAQGFMNDMNAAQVIQNLEGIAVTNGMLVIKAKAP